MITANDMTKQDKMYIALCALFSVFIVLANATCQKFIYLPALPFHTFVLSAGALFYPFMFMLTDLIAEFYDKKKANFCVRLAVCMNISAALILLGIDSLEATPWSRIDNSLFHLVFGLSGAVVIANIIACYTAQLVDIVLYLWIKKITNSRFLWLRNSGSTAISLFMDSFIAISLLTLFNVFPRDKMWEFMVNSYFYKLFMTICNIPVFYLLVWGVKKFILSKNIPTVPEQPTTGQEELTLQAT